MFLGITIIILALVIAVGLGLFVSNMQRQNERMKDIEAKLGVAVVPFFKYVLSVLAAEITHPHDKYKELDGLVAEALLEPETHMSDERLELMDKLLDERSVDTSPEMRPGEGPKALIVKQLVHLIRMEGASLTPLTDFRVVGIQQPESQSATEEPKPPAGSEP